MAFYNPLQSGPDWGGGIQDLMQQFMMYKLISQMYPGDEKGKKKGEKETLRGMPKIGEIFRDVSPTDLPSAREMPLGGLRLGGLPEMMNLPMGQPPMGQAQQQPGIDMQQIMQMLQMLGGIPGLTK